MANRGLGVLAMAGNMDIIGADFWCALYGEGHAPLFEHNRLTGPRDIQRMPAHVSQLEPLREYFGYDVDNEEVSLALISSFYKNALERHEALAEALLLPKWSVGLGYSQIIEGRWPPEAGAPTKPPKCLADLRPLPEWVTEILELDLGKEFEQACQTAFGFLVEDFGFRRDRPQPSSDARIPAMAFYSREDLRVVIQGASYDSGLQLYLIDKTGNRLLDLSDLVERRNPEFFDLCCLAVGQREVLPSYANALRTYAADVLAGDLREIRPMKGFRAPGISFGDFLSKAEKEEFLARYGSRYDEKS
jgi:hypothetical protein